jgi:hypothetical protein
VNTISLTELDERAALQRRVDQKYLVPRALFQTLVSKLDSAYEVLEIDGDRAFGYESVYFDTPDLLCFRQHVEDREPRFKTRSRLYESADSCVFEVKVKQEGGTMDKRHLDRAPEQHGRLDDEACQFLDEVLAENDFEPVSERLEPRLTTRFTRRTFAAREGAERVTCDRYVELRRAEGSAAFLDPDHILIESKSEGGTGDWDDALQAEGIEPISFSKYRVGHSLLGAQDPEEPLPPWARELFTVSTG